MSAAYGSAESSDGATGADLTASAEPAPRSKLRATLAVIGWSAFGVFFLLLFTLLKLPEDRIKNYVQGTIGQVLAAKGLSFSAEKGAISMGLGLKYVMKNVTISSDAGDEPPAKIEEISFSPGILSLMTGAPGGTLYLKQAGKVAGELESTFSMRGTSFSVSFDAKNLDLGKLHALATLAGVKAGGMLTGKGSFSGDMNVPSTLTGNADLLLSQVVIESQAIQGFNVPKLYISEAKAEIAAEKGKATIRALRLAKGATTTAGVDDLQALVTGDVMLGRNWDSSTLSAKATFRVSETVTKAFVLLDALLGSGKQADGSYGFSLSGPVFSPQSVPLGK